ncbi:hypothetical protein [Burkholderia sp. MSMB1498]|uniref:hypothetical protein n=1 Tax=Burkholderia sp. MSMB1498 TaxID=1637842 RepID=UPI000752BAA1|nr:hypothetical protein [Burkholderia sp. MSMB1498]KVK77796.1 hypothetical protein WS91_15140 [Burkholderia sp. MSMB1498]
MKKKLLATFCVAAALSACGGGDDVAAPANTGPTIRLTYSGDPIITARVARAMAASDGASPVVPSGLNAQATIDALQAAFKARGADIGVYPGVIDGTALHQLVQAENGGVGPSRDEVLKANVNVSEWVLMNFQLDDMAGYVDTPEKRAAVSQFQRDLEIYAAREYLKGRVVHAVLPIVSCQPVKVERYTDDTGVVRERSYRTASSELYGAVYAASLNDIVGFRTVGGQRDSDPAHMGADCSTPDQIAQDAQINSIVDPLTINYKAALETIEQCKHNPEAIPEYIRGAQCWGIEPVKK